MDTISDSQQPSLGVDVVDLRELEQRLQLLAARLTARSQLPSQDAIELLCRSTSLRRAAFVLRAELAAAEIELRDHLS